MTYKIKKGISKNCHLLSIKNKNFILIILSLFLILESAVMIFIIRKNEFSQTPKKKMAFLSLEPKNGSFKVGEEFEIKIILDTEEWETDATDVRLSYEPQILKVVKIIPGKIYDDYPTKKADEERKVIVINGITSLSRTFKGKDIFATLVLKGLKPGRANLIFEFALGSTTDSNVVASGIAKDILEEVEGASFEIN